MKRHLVAVVGYVVATLATQATSHFGVNSAHYAAVPYIKVEPIFPLGLAAMLLQGAVLSYIYAGSRFADRSIFSAVKLSWLFGVFLISYIALAEAAKYAVPSVTAWIAVEAAVGFIQFTLIGVILGLSHRLGLPPAAKANTAS